jgi:dTDP-4-amino-4,6-dideoxygalactose transaminase
VYHQYTIGVGTARDQIVTDMKDAGVICGIYYPIPCHRQAYVMELGIDGDLPNTDAAAASSMSLPMYPGLTETEQSQVIEALRASVMHNAATTGERR